MTKPIATTTVSFSDFADPTFTAPSRFYYKDAMGDFVFIHLRTRALAQEYLNTVYGKGFYKVRSYGVEAQDNEITAR